MFSCGGGGDGVGGAACTARSISSSSVREPLLPWETVAVGTTSFMACSVDAIICTATEAVPEREVRGDQRHLDAKNLTALTQREGSSVEKNDKCFSIPKAYNPGFTTNFIRLPLGIVLL